MTEIKQKVRLRIGCIPYLIASPFTFSWHDTESYEFITAPPRQIAHLARENELDAACLPLDDARSLQRRFEPLGQIGLIVEKAGPAALFASRIEANLLGQAPIGVSMQAATARHVLHILLTKRYGVTAPQFVPLPPDQTQQLGGCLIVGDPAFQFAQESRPHFPHTYDLAAAWREWTKTPLVLGRWMVRKTVPDAMKETLLQCITNSIHTAQQQLSDVAEHHNKYVSANVLHTSAALQHLQGCRYHIDDLAQQSIDTFQKHVRSLRPKKRTWRDELAEG